MDKIDLFISHAGEDKEDLVRPLAETLKKFGVSIWYDEFELKLGDSLIQKIDYGLANSEYGLVALSPSFLQKGFPEYELRGLLSKEIGYKKVILPLWHNLTKEELIKYSPTLADKYALRTFELGITELAVEIIKVVRPDLSTKILRRLEFLKADSQTEKINIKKLKLGPPVHDKLSDQQIESIRLIRAVLLGVMPHSMEYWIEGFKHDAHPSREIRIWEHIASCYLEYISIHELTIEQHKQVFKLIFLLSHGTDLEELEDKSGLLPKNAVEELFLIVRSQYPIYEIEDEKFPESYDLSSREDYLLRLPDLEYVPDDIPDELLKKLIKSNNENAEDES